jgi:hypothetical protein
MLSFIKHAIRVAHAVVREHVKKITRSPKWSATRKTFLDVHTSCAFCNSTTLLQVHHMQPFHLKPALELDPKNLIVLCMGPNECHLLVGHGDNFQKYNPYIAADMLNVRAGSITLLEAQRLAKKNAIFLPVDIDN